MRELGFHDGVDTLGRWMAHHLAELIRAAEKGSTAERSKAKKDATATILNIWKHRASLPGRAYPLTPYKDVLNVLDRLRPDDNPFRYWGREGENRNDQLAADLFGGLSRLIIALLLMKVPSGERSAEVGAAAVEALDDAEQRVLIGLQQWGAIFASTLSANVGETVG